MPLSTDAFLRNYVAAIAEGHAALLVGAGLSQPSGFVDWRGLLRDCALELGLDIDREHDLVAVAQYYLNRRQHDRSRLNQILVNEFDRPATATRNHEIIGRLPIETIWTTNFDSLLEQALRAAGRTVDVKSRDRDIATSRKGTDAFVYKMHGDIARPDEVVVCKEDYERYARAHPIFQNALEGDLVSKTFLIIGFSFADPHLDYMLGHLNTLLEGSKREHYTVMRRVRLNWHDQNPDAQREFEYEQNRQSLQIEDLQRYSIQTVLIDEYDELTTLLEAIERRLSVRNVFVSGSANQFGDFGEMRMRDLCMALGERMVDGDFHLICGMGLNVGDSVVKGALVHLFGRHDVSMERHVSLRPFPRNLPAEVSEENFNRSYRESMIRKAGVAIFIAGTSRSAPASLGVMKEYEMVRAMGKIAIPIGATGFAARKIWEQMNENVEAAYAGAVPPELFQKLNDETLSNEQLLDAVFEVIQRVEKAYTATPPSKPAAKRRRQKDAVES